MRKLAVTTLVSLLLTIGIAVACDGCWPDGTIDTFFSAEGQNIQYSEALYLTGLVFGHPVTHDGMIENAWTSSGSMTVLKNIDLEDHYFWGSKYTDANIDKQIWIDPGCFASANVETYAYWDGFGGEYYREAFLGNTIVDIVSASNTGDGEVLDDIYYQGDLYVYESIGLNRPATCDLPDMPDMPDPPTCEEWFCR